MGAGLPSTFPGNTAAHQGVSSTSCPLLLGCLSQLLCQAAASHQQETPAAPHSCKVSSPALCRTEHLHTTQLQQASC